VAGTLDFFRRVLIFLSRMHDAFKPAWWCRGPHAQTLWPFLWRRTPRVTLRRERIELPDGDFLDLDWTPGRNGPVVLVLHGLEGSSNSKYARGLLRAVHARGWRGAVMHFRGCSGEPNRLARGYHSGETGDVAHVIDLLRQREPAAPLYVVGFSLGGNVLLKWLGTPGVRAPIRAAVAVSVPFLLAESARRLDRGFSRIYQWGLMRSLRRSVSEKRKRMALPLRIQDISTLRTFWDFDEHVTAPLHGFAGAEDYYTRSSSRQYLKNIQVPTLIVHSRDDPFMTPAAIPQDRELSSAIRLETHDNGGHVGFVAGSFPWKPDYWLERRVLAFLNKDVVPS
jgi:predicted alpha/beta-fold hydrolase